MAFSFQFSQLCYLDFTSTSVDVLRNWKNVHQPLRNEMKSFLNYGPEFSLKGFDFLGNYVINNPTA